MTEIRPLEAADLPAIGAIFQKAFRKSDAPPPAALLSCMDELFFRHPWRDEAVPSLVHVTPEGRIGGYIGVIPLRMRLGDQVLRAATPTTIAVSEPAKNPLAGAKLLRTFLNGAQDISVSEPINPLALGMWERSGARVPVQESMEWLTVFRPAACAATLTEDRVPLGRFLRPVLKPLDRLAARFARGGNARPARGGGIFDRAMSREEFIPHFLAVAEAYDLRPDWDAEVLGWQLDHAAGNTLRGPLHLHAATDKTGTPVGACVYHARPGGMAWVVQLLAHPEHADAVVACMIAHLREAGYAAAKGRTQARLVDPLLRHGALLFRRHAAIVHARDENLTRAVHEGRAITSGFAGETWTRLVSDQFR